MNNIKLDQHYVDPRLVVLYDIDNPLGIDSDFYIRLASKVQAKTIIDLGCGTGLLTRKLATGKRKVVGIDPASVMLAYAQRQPDAEKVEWINGSSADLGERNADLVIMTGNVAQVFLDESEWVETVTAIYSTLKSGGRLAFETRNPAAKAWEEWTQEKTFQRIDSPFGPIESWLEVVGFSNGRLHFRGINRFIDSGEEVIVDSHLRFRSKTEIEQSLHNAGFSVEHVYGDWIESPMEPLSRAMIFVAKRQ